MPANRAVGLSLGAAILLCSSSLDLARANPFMIVGNDEKVWWDDDGKPVLSAPGKDAVLIVDLATALLQQNQILDRRLSGLYLGLHTSNLVGVDFSEATPSG